MNNRLNIQDLAGLLSERTGKDRGEVERFLRDFISVVSEGVYTDKLGYFQDYLCGEAGEYPREYR
jgi:hypothetical protein